MVFMSRFGLTDLKDSGQIRHTGASGKCFLAPVQEVASGTLPFTRTIRVNSFQRSSSSIQILNLANRTQGVASGRRLTL